MEIWKPGFISSAAHPSTCLPLVTRKGTFFRIRKHNNLQIKQAGNYLN